MHLLLRRVQKYLRNTATLVESPQVFVSRVKIVDLIEGKRPVVTVSFRNAVHFSYQSLCGSSNSPEKEGIIYQTEMPEEQGPFTIPSGGSVSLPMGYDTQFTKADMANLESGYYLFVIGRILAMKTE